MVLFDFNQVKKGLFKLGLDKKEKNTPQLLNVYGPPLTIITQFTIKMFTVHRDISIMFNINFSGCKNSNLLNKIK